MSAEVAPDPAAARRALAHGEITVHGRIAGSSNVTLFATCALDDTELAVVYKPARGERPLWDFPTGLHRREVAAYVLSETLGWGLVPLTIERLDAPLGIGSLQLFVDEDGESHYFTLRAEERWTHTLHRLAVFDVVANSADRKSGHVLLADDRLWAIDNGLSFHRQPKLRTVIWDFAGDRLSAEETSALERLVSDPLSTRLEELLEPGEGAALLRRATRLLKEGCLPAPGDDDWRPYPWPLV
ncbi:MAG TPA: SCO1664 family protein [Acidimicrobiales bacterium]|nr:SCO1664 family protein [Acidimicrobiales bacterium]